MYGYSDITTHANSDITLKSRRFLFRFVFFE